MTFTRVSLIALSVSLAAAGAQAATKTVTSPDGRTQISVEYGNGGMTYAVSRDGKPIIAPSPLGLRTDKGALGQGPQTLKNAADKSVNETFQLVVGKTKDVVDKAKELIDKLREKIQIVKDFAKEIRDSFVQTADLSALDLAADSTSGSLVDQLQKRADQTIRGRCRRSRHAPASPNRCCSRPKKPIARSRMVESVASWCVSSTIALSSAGAMDGPREERSAPRAWSRNLIRPPRSPSP